MTTRNGSRGEQNASVDLLAIVPDPLTLAADAEGAELRNRAFFLACAKGYPRLDLAQGREVKAGESGWRDACSTWFPKFVEQAYRALDAL